jgi:hypothetical protein
MQDYLMKLERELKMRNYSPRTVKAYTACVESFLKFIDNGHNGKKGVAGLNLQKTDN